MFDKRLQNILTVVDNNPVTGHYDYNGNLVDVRPCEVIVRITDEYVHIKPNRFRGDNTMAIKANPTSVSYAVDTVGNIVAYVTISINTENGVFTRDIAGYVEHMPWLLKYCAIPKSIRSESINCKSRQGGETNEYVSGDKKRNKFRSTNSMPSDDDLFEWVAALNKSEFKELKFFCLNQRSERKISKMIKDHLYIDAHELIQKILDRLKELLVK